jgi:predicted nucleic acid-binding protein
LIVLDASAALGLLLNTSSGQRIADRIRSPRVSLHAPHLIDLEVAQALRRYAMTHAVSSARGRQALEHLRQLDLARYRHDVLLSRVWALRANLTAYDAAYVALAEVLKAPLLTCDRRLASAAGALARIELA